jgi:hypothetical protein
MRPSGRLLRWNNHAPTNDSLGSSNNRECNQFIPRSRNLQQKASKIAYNHDRNYLPTQGVVVAELGADVGQVAAD